MDWWALVNDNEKFDGNTSEEKKNKQVRGSDSVKDASDAFRAKFKTIFHQGDINVQTAHG